MIKTFAKGIFLPVCFLFQSGIVTAQKNLPKSTTLTAPLSAVTITEQATESTTAYNLLSSGNITYIAGTVIMLKPGFHVTKGTSFKAKITEGEPDNRAALNGAHNVEDNN